ncbi:hypothetical protein F5887DRAFT_1200917 [Amanita rubescens]|nr:hypothetical protein F5887DRAFT_1200917 [Amanita rubescens]
MYLRLRRLGIGSRVVILRQDRIKRFKLAQPGRRPWQARTTRMPTPSGHKCEWFSFSRLERMQATERGFVQICKGSTGEGVERIVLNSLQAVPTVVNSQHAACIGNFDEVLEIASRLIPQTKNAIISTEERGNTSEHTPLTKTAFTLSKLSPVASLRAYPSNRLINEPKSSLSIVSERHNPNVVTLRTGVERNSIAYCLECKKETTGEGGRVRSKTTADRGGDGVIKPQLGRGSMVLENHSWVRVQRFENTTTGWGINSARKPHVGWCWKTAAGWGINGTGKLQLSGGTTVREYHNWVGRQWCWKTAGEWGCNGARIPQLSRGSMVLENCRRVRALWYWKTAENYSGAGLGGAVELRLVDSTPRKPHVSEAEMVPEDFGALASKY